MNKFEKFLQKHNPKIKLNKAAKNRIYNRLFKKPKKIFFFLRPQFILGGAAAAVALISVSTYFMGRAQFDMAASAEYTPEPIELLQHEQPIEDTMDSKQLNIEKDERATETIAAEEKTMPVPESSPIAESTVANGLIAEIQTEPPVELPSSAMDSSLGAEDIIAFDDADISATARSYDALVEEQESFGVIEEDIAAINRSVTADEEVQADFYMKKAAESVVVTLEDYLAGRSHIELPDRFYFRAADFYIANTPLPDADVTTVKINNTDTLELYYSFQISPDKTDFSKVEEYQYILLYLLALQEENIKEQLLQYMKPHHRYYDLFYSINSQDH